MFTVCPKCALTLVVTAQDLRVAQGYVRCGRCSNVFNAIVGLTDDRGALTQGTASTSIIRKAPSISDDEPARSETLNDTGESEAVYAEPDANEVKFQEVFAEPTPPTRTTARTPAPTPAPTPDTRAPGAISFVAPPPGPPARAPASTQTSKALDAEKRYSDTEGIDTYPESELEFNPDLTDVTKVFVEAAPVAFKGDATGKFRKFVMGAEQPDPTEPPASNAPVAPSSAPATPSARSPANAATQPRANAAASASAPNSAASSARSQSAGFNAGAANTGASNAGTSSAAASSSKPGAARSNAPNSPAPAPRTSPATPPPTPPDRDDEDVEIDGELRSLAARLDGTTNRPAPKFPPAAANDEAVEGEEDEGGGLGDIYAKAVPRPRPPPPAPPSRATPARRASRNTYVDDSDDFGAETTVADADAEMQAVDSAIDTFTPATPPRSRFMWWVAGAAVLSVVLVGQAIHHNRHSLATNALLNRPLTKFYKAIGVSLVPSWDLRSYDVRQLGASTSETGDGTLTVRASLKNNASQPLPLPLLRITMQDRYGNRIATRDVPPAGYAPGALPAEAHLGAGQRIDAEMTFKDPGQNAVGFEIDACLPTATGRIACANDQSPTLR
jgi:predicted Zn finger-like uncharacterized protein